MKSIMVQLQALGAKYLGEWEGASWWVAPDALYVYATTAPSGLVNAYARRWREDMNLDYVKAHVSAQPDTRHWILCAENAAALQTAGHLPAPDSQFAESKRGQVPETAHALTLRTARCKFVGHAFGISWWESFAVGAVFKKFGGTREGAFVDAFEYDWKPGMTAEAVEASCRGVTKKYIVTTAANIRTLRNECVFDEPEACETTEHDAMDRECTNVDHVDGYAAGRGQDCRPMSLPSDADLNVAVDRGLADADAARFNLRDCEPHTGWTGEDCPLVGRVRGQEPTPIVPFDSNASPNNPRFDHGLPSPYTIQEKADNPVPMVFDGWKHVGQPGFAENGSDRTARDLQIVNTAITMSARDNYDLEHEAGMPVATAESTFKKYPPKKASGW